MANPFLFMGLFIIVGGVVKVGLISKLSEGLITLTNPTAGSMFTLSVVMLWFSAIGSSIVDNIPFVASMIPLVKDTAEAVLPGEWELKTPSSTCNPYARLVVIGVRHLPRAETAPRLAPQQTLLLSGLPERRGTP